MRDRLLRPEEAAEILSVSPTSVKKWLRAGRLKGVKVSGMWRIYESALDQIIEEVNVEETELSEEEQQ